MDQERRCIVQQYIERQKAYLPTYTAVDPVNERHHGRTPPKQPPKNDAYGFDTPVLRPRASVRTSPKAQIALQAGPKTSRSRAHDADLPRPPRTHKGARLERREPDQAKKDETRTKRKKDPKSTPVDTDDERAAILADRRERKRTKRAIVNSPRVQDDDVRAKKGKTTGQKAKKPPALALLYGFSATNVTKDRLTVKPAPSLGVFSKGKASAKKKVTATKKTSSRNELFSESAFLNRPNGQANDPSKVDDDSDGSSVSSVPQEIRKKNRSKCTKPMATKASRAHTVVESEIWDIELHSKLPSSVCDISSEPRAESSIPVIMDPRSAEWSACLDTAEKYAEGRDKTRTPSLSVVRSRSMGHSVVRSPPRAIPDRRDELGLSLAADVSTIHPFHSASQVGARGADARPTDLRPVTSKYFTEPTPVPVQESEVPAKPSQAPKSTDDIGVRDSRITDQNDMDAPLDIQMIHGGASPINSLISVLQPMVQYRTRYDMVPLEFPSDSSPYDGFYADVHVPLRGYVDSCAVEQGEEYITVEPCRHPPQGDAWDWCQTRSSLAGLTIDDVDVEVTYDDPSAPECGGYLDEPEALVEPCYFEAEARFESEEEQDRWYSAAETGHNLSIYEDATNDQVSLNEDVPGFLEGRTLLLGIPEDHEERVRCVGMTGLAQAEMDVASRLRDHWRPLRL